MNENDDFYCMLKHDLWYTLAITTLDASLRNFPIKYPGVVGVIGEHIVIKVPRICFKHKLHHII